MNGLSSGRLPSIRRSTHSPVLLTMPAYGGTLAAVRQLGMSGVPVVVAGHNILGAARWSRHASRFVSCPPVQDGGRFVEWLIAYGERHPGHVLLPTSDEMVLLFASNLKLLETNFRLYQPSLESTLRVLDKKLLWEACRQVGIDTLPSWFPSGEEELRNLATNLPYPVLIKPRSQVQRIRRNQGVVVRGPGDLLSSYRAVVTHTGKSGYNELSDADAPLVQQFAEEGNEAVYSVSGFIDRGGELMVAGGATKVFQRRRPVGIGVCFEASPLEDGLAEGVKRLCREVGHFGVFEVEFVRWKQKWAVIDFNPRFYHQMGLDIARGLPLPMWTYLGACGEESFLQLEMQRPLIRRDGRASAFCDQFTFRTLLTAMRITGRLSGVEVAAWKRWFEEHRADAVDIAIDMHDPIPGFVHVLSELKLGLQAVPRFLSAPRAASRTVLPLRRREIIL
jgi:D-aspartate ligase